MTSSELQERQELVARDLSVLQDPHEQAAPDVLVVHWDDDDVADDVVDEDLMAAGAAVQPPALAFEHADELPRPDGRKSWTHAAATMPRSTCGRGRSCACMLSR
jgi:hypothetical protein